MWRRECQENKQTNKQTKAEIKKKNKVKREKMKEAARCSHFNLPLSRRANCGKVSGPLTSEMKYSMGVPQGSVLAPPVFSLYK